MHLVPGLYIVFTRSVRPPRPMNHRTRTLPPVMTSRVGGTPTTFPVGSQRPTKVGSSLRPLDRKIHGTEMKIDNRRLVFIRFCGTPSVAHTVTRRSTSWYYRTSGVVKCRHYLLSDRVIRRRSNRDSDLKK